MSRGAPARSVLAAGVTAAVAAAMVVAVAGPARASATVLCTGTQHGTYAPPLTAIPRPTSIHIEEDLSCVGGDFSVAHVSEVLGPQTTSCLLPGDPFPQAGTFRYEWDGGESYSDVTYTTTTLTRPLGQTIVTNLGTVVDGSYEGARVARVVTLVTPSALDCLSGIETLSGPSTLTLTQ
jgi:hypothetical protein